MKDVKMDIKSAIVELRYLAEEIKCSCRDDYTVNKRHEPNSLCEWYDTICSIGKMLEKMEDPND